MRKTSLVAALAVFSCFAVPLFSQEQISASRRTFIKGSIGDKTAAVREASGSEPALAEAGLDFVIENQAYFPGDRDMAALALASVLALPKAEAMDRKDNDYADRLSGKLVAVFAKSSDDTVRIAVLDKLVPLLSLHASEQAMVLLNSALTDAASAGDSPSSVSLAVLSAVGRLGNSDSFAIIYSIWKNRKWQQNSQELEAALAGISLRLHGDAVKVIVSADIAEAGEYFAVLKKNGKNHQEFLAEIAENLLLKTINSAEGFSEKAAVLQLEALSVIADAHWTRASKLVSRYFALAKDEYASGLLTEEQFTAVIGDLAKLASPDSAPMLSAYLTDLNKSAAESAVPARHVVLAVISALGELGDKTAFDPLLYVTYLSYPEEVVQAAREALARLKW